MKPPYLDQSSLIPATYSQLHAQPSLRPSHQSIKIPILINLKSQRRSREKIKNWRKLRTSNQIRVWAAQFVCRRVEPRIQVCWDFTHLLFSHLCLYAWVYPSTSLPAGSGISLLPSLPSLLPCSPLHPVLPLTIIN